MIWRLADAKNKLSEVVVRAINEGPQRISRRGKLVVVVSDAEFDRLRGQQPSFTAYLLDGPDLSDIDLERDQTPMREAAW
jgi:prevent-host-death family protein